MKITKQLCLFIAMLLVIAKANATHLMGGEITYKWVSGNTYSVELSLYRDCSGIAVSNTQDISVNSVTAGYTSYITANVVSISYTPEICPASSANTFCNFGTNFGYEKVIYSGIITLPANASDWKFSHNSCCRNGAISNLVNPDSYELLLESKLDNLNGPNNSPQFSTQPVIIIHTGETQILSWNAFDMDGDLLEYHLADPMSISDSAIPYNTGFSVTQPFTGFLPTVFDSSTGVMFASPSIQQAVVVSMLITEKRQGVTIGSVRRDLQMVVLPGTANHCPALTGYNGSNNFEMDIIADSLVTFNIQSNDVDTGQQLSLTWDSALVQLGAVYTTIPSGLHPGASINWTPHLNALLRSPVCFTLSVRDDNCPFNSVQIFTYKFNIFPATHLLLSAGNNIGICTSDSGRLNANIAGGVAPFTYRWSPSQGLSNPNILNPLASPGSTTRYYLSVTDGGGATATDSVLVTIMPGVIIDSIRITNVTCFGGSNGSACCYVSGGTSSYNYIWNNSANFQCMIGVSASAYSLTVTDANACSASASLSITQPPLLEIDSVVSNDAYCYGDTNGSICVYVSGGTSVLSQGYNFTWTPYVGSQAVNTFCCIQNLGGNSYSVTVSDAHYCTASASATVLQPPVFEAQIFSDGGGSSPDTLSVQVAGGVAPFSYQWYFNNTAISGAVFETHIATQSGNYKIAVTDSAGCQAYSAESFIQLGCAAHYTLYPDTTTPHHWFALDQSTGNAPITYLWYWGDGDSSTGLMASHIYAAPGNYNICLRIADGTFCSSAYCDSSTYVYKTESDIISINVVGGLITGIEERVALAGAVVYPNPAGDFLLAEANRPIKKIEVFDISGKLCLYQYSDKAKTILPVNKLGAGIYFCRIYLSNAIHTQKFIKE